MQNKFNPLEYYQVFIGDKQIECCKSPNCVLCNGQQYAQINENDYEIIGNIIVDKLHNRINDIKQKLKNINNVDQFLQFHKNQSNMKYEMITLWQSKTKQENEQISFIVKYKNTGEKDWPEPLFLQCKTKGFENLKIKVKSLKQQEEYEQEISFKLPDNTSINNVKMSLEQLMLEWQLSYQNEGNDIVFGPIIDLELEYLDNPVTYNLQQLDNLVKRFDVEEEQTQKVTGILKNKKTKLTEMEILDIIFP